MRFKESNTKGVYSKLTAALLLGKLMNTPISIFIVKLLGTLAYGKLTLYNIAVSYFSHSHMGTLTNLNREVLFDFSRGDDEIAAMKINNVFSLYLIIALILSLLYTICDLLMVFESGLGRIVILLPLTVLTKASYTLFYSTLKSYGQFDIYSNMDLVNKILFPLCTLLGVYLFDLYGYLLAIILVDWICILINFRRSYHKLKLTLNARVISALFSTGAHMYLNKIIDVIFITSSVLYLSKEGRLLEIGIFGFAFAIFNINKLPLVSPYVITTSRDFTVGYETRSLKENRTKLLNYTAKMFMLNLAVASFMIIVYTVLVEYFLKEYYESVKIMLILFPGIIIYNLRYVSFLFFDVVGKFGIRSILSLSSCIGYSVYLYVNIGYLTLTDISRALSLLFVVNGILAHIFMLLQIGTRKSQIVKLMGKVIVFTTLFAFILYWFMVVPFNFGSAWELGLIMCSIFASLLAIKWSLRDYAEVNLLEMFKSIKS